MMLLKIERNTTIHVKIYKNKKKKKKLMTNDTYERNSTPSWVHDNI